MHQELEIERKYRILSWTPEAARLLLIGANFSFIRQGYFSVDPAIRVRISSGYDCSATLTIKTGHDPLGGRIEETILLNRFDALELLEQASYTVEKIRIQNGRYEFDFFLGLLKRLENLEIELKRSDEKVKLPEGLELQEVTHDSKYLNVNLAQFDGMSELDGVIRGSLTITNIDDGLNYCQQAIASRIQKAEKLPIIVGISGSSASGKSSRVSSKLKEHFGDDVAVLDMDSYFIGKEQMKKDGVEIFDDPRAIDLALMFEHILALSRGESIQKPVYSFVTGEREEYEIFTSPARVLIVEGLFALHPAFKKLFDFSIFVDVSIHGALWRRIKRDIERTNEKPVEIFTRIAREVYPTYKVHVDYQRYFADVIIENEMKPQDEMVLSDARETQVKVFLDKNLYPNDILEEVRDMLLDMGFEETEELFLHRDSYFTPPASVVIFGKEIIRIRSEWFEEGKNPRIVLTYKGPKDEAHFNTRGRLEFEIGKDDESLLEGLDYELLGVIVKSRRVFRHASRDIAIVLDFITKPRELVALEVQAPKFSDVEEMVRILQNYRIPKECFTDASYLEILLEN